MRGETLLEDGREGGEAGSMKGDDFLEGKGREEAGKGIGDDANGVYVENHSLSLLNESLVHFKRSQVVSGNNMKRGL